MIPIDARKYTKICSILTMNSYMFRPNIWPIITAIKYKVVFYIPEDSHTYGRNM